ncbi:MAG: class I SAM-dependent methyltransferase, partial [Nitrospinota bacterium]|nr:class I SAM-dependent methyltransferase [Nitrospinota bacterium]
MGAIRLDKVPLNGRSLEEYSAIFGLDFAKGGFGPILDVASGPSTFADQAHKLGLDITAADPSYALPKDLFFQTSLSQIAGIREKIEPVAGSYKWDYYKSPDHLRKLREKTLSDFIEGFSRQTARGTYVAGRLPSLPFKDSSFQLVLCSHFLFLFSHILDFDFHFKSILELTRVSSGQVRIYPVTGLDGVSYQFLDQLILQLENMGIESALYTTGFEFLKGANKALELRPMRKV